ncbi:MAG: hypothetical protein K0S34_1898, partial [Bacillales bacterium]|nr:hypothetical protein [Bacillales bacterium]
IGIGYITNGQNVPDDIIESTPLTIVNLIIEGLNNERSS